MIIAFFLDILFLIVSGLLYPIKKLDDVSVESGIGSAINNGIHYIANFNEILPLSTLFIIFGIILSIEASIGLFKIIMWIIRRFPTQS